jgi:sarcosine oxidase subunit gamma
MISNEPETLRIFALRSFGESLYHSITDACLEDGYQGI